MEKKRLPLFLYLFILLFSSCSGNIILSLTIPKETDGFIIETLASSLTGKEYAVYTALPEGYDPSGEPYPVVILTDGDDYAAGTWRKLKKARASGELGDIVLVGVGYGRETNRRGEDLTPTSDPAWDTASYGTGGELESGHADDFLSFITVDLLSFLETSYNLTSFRDNRCLAGHSLGGLFSVYALTRVSDTFGLFVASSPALYWDSHVLFLLLQEWTLDATANHDVRLYASIGDQEDFPNGLYLEDFIQRLNNIDPVEASWSIYDYSLHGQVWEKGIPDGIAAVFRKPE